MDYAVMEPASADGLVYTVPAEFGWSDLGNWQSLYERLDKDADGNAVVGKITLSGCRDCIVHAEDSEELVLEGLEGYIVAAKDGRILVCRRSEEQRINNLKK